MILGKILWLSPQSLAGRNPIDVWGDYIRKRGNWELVSEWDDDVDIIFFGSDSVLDDDLLSKDVLKICYFWDVLPWRMLDPEFRTWFSNQVERMKKCDLILTPSTTILYQALTLGLNAIVCTPGIDSELINLINAGEKKYQICSVSRITPHKQHDWVIKTASLLNPRPKVVIVGSGDSQPLLKLADDLGVECVITPMSDEDKIKTIKESLCLVSSSMWEGFGMAPIEGMYCGTPVFVIDTPIHREILKEFVIYFTNPIELAQKIAYLLNNKMLGEEIGRRGGEYVKQNLTFEKATDRLESVFNNMIKRSWRKKLSKDTWKEIYDREAKRNITYHSYRFNPRWERYWEPRYFLKLFEEYGIKEVIDVGSGAVHPVIFALDGYKVKAVDISEEVIKQGKELADREGVSDKIEWIHGSVEELPFEDNGAECVVMSQLLEHLPEPERAVAEGLRILKPGGIFIIGVPLGMHHYDPLHLHVFEIEDMKRIGERFKDICDIVRLETIAEPGCEPSVIVMVLRRK
ncbi:MAG: hypothetical protein DRP88_06465 [Candidatus Neomarinimicrobiota bacterium]|nr:MAG: hypothetical protein DRP88_06465 [Candidatus Neomarinimicrobiota bacterium]